MNETPIRSRTVSLIGKLLKPLADEGLLSVAEYREVIANLKHLASKGTLCPRIAPRLLNQREVAEMLGVSLANWKKIEREGHVDIPRRRIGSSSSVRYRNTDVIKLIMAEDMPEEDADP